MTAAQLADARSAGWVELDLTLALAWSRVLEDVARDPADAVSPAARARGAIDRRRRRDDLTADQARRLLGYLDARIAAGHAL